MSNRKERITKQLGMSQGTAVHRLRKNIMFKFAQDLGYDDCFACGRKIETPEDLSIEHKEPWESRLNGDKLFWDLDNIAFSHIKCNVPHIRHIPLKAKCGGNGSAYRRGCRCDDCKEAQRLRVSSQRNRKTKV